LSVHKSLKVQLFPRRTRNISNQRRQKIAVTATQQAAANKANQVRGSQTPAIERYSGY
jgi:hypothetical protein